MSRTYRRKKGDHPPRWITDDYVCTEERKGKKYSWNGNWYNHTYRLYAYVPRTGKDRRKHIKMYRADKNQGYYSAPSKFVNTYFTKKDRAQERQELKRILQRADDYEEYSFKPYKHGAMWEWW